MKVKSIILACVACTFFLAYACGDKVERPTPIMTQDQIDANKAEFDAPTIPSGGVVGGVKHYTCPNGHEGSDAQGSCIVCGTQLVHNQAFHDQQATTPPAAGAEPPQNTSGVWHYTCPNGHDGGSGSATACTQCGTTLVHNQGYHDGTNATTPAATPSVTTPPPAPEPAQNADGVWHYTCPNGHEGGAGSASACTVCGTTLAHNQFYHN